MQIIITNDAFDIVKIGEITFKLSIKKSFLKHLYCKHCGHRLALEGTITGYKDHKISSEILDELMPWNMA